MKVCRHMDKLNVTPAGVRGVERGYMCLKKVRENIFFGGNETLLMKILFQTGFTHWFLQKTAKKISCQSPTKEDWTVFLLTFDLPNRFLCGECSINELISF